MQRVWWTYGLSSTDKLVLLKYADSANADGTDARPSQKRSAAETGLCPRAIQKSLRRLVDEGFLIKVAKASPKRGLAAVYRVDLERLAEHDPREGAPRLGEPRSHEPRSREPRSINRRTRFAPPVQDPSIEKKVCARARPDVVGTGDDVVGEFERWWSIYPKKVGRGQALRAYTAALKKVTASALLEALQRHLPVMEATPRRFVKNPATWLNGECWGDEFETAPSAAAGARQPSKQETLDEAWRELSDDLGIDATEVGSTR